MDRILICWNQSQYVENINIDGYEIDKFKSRTEFMKDFAAKSKNAAYIVVLCELTWSHEVEDKPYSDMSGIKLVQHIRKEGIKLPVLFISFLSRKDILEKHPDAEIIRTPALKHGFCQLPSNTSQWIKKLEELTVNKELKTVIEEKTSMYGDKTINNKFPEMTDLDLIYTKRRFCGIVGLLEQINHDISGCWTKETLEEKLKKMEFANEITNFAFKGDIDSLSKMIKSINEEDKEIFATIHKKFKEICKEIIASSKKEKPNEEGRVKKPEKQKYNILYLEDEFNKDEGIKKLVKTMNDQGFTVTDINKPDYNELFLKKGKKGTKTQSETSLKSRNKILFDAIICDIEIWEEKDGDKELTCLGYDYILRLSKMYRHPVYIILSNVTRSLHNDILNNLETRVNTYSKSDVLVSDATIQVFIDGIKNLIEQKKENEKSQNEKEKPREKSCYLKRFKILIENLATPEAIEIYIQNELDILIGVFEERYKKEGKIKANFLSDKIGEFSELGKVKFENNINEITDKIIVKFIKVLIARRLLIYVMLKHNFTDLHPIFSTSTNKLFLQHALFFYHKIKRDFIWNNETNKIQDDCKNFLSKQEIAYIKQLKNIT